MLVRDLAKKLGVSNKDIVDLFEEDAKTQASKLTDEEVEFVTTQLSSTVEIEVKTETKKIDKTAEATRMTKMPVRTSLDYKPNDLIPCRSIFNGRLLFTGSHSGLTYPFEGMNDMQYVEYQDLRAAMLGKKDPIMKPYIIIEDENLLEDMHWKAVKERYDLIYKYADIDDILSLPTPKFKEEFRSLPIGLKKNVMLAVSTMVKNGEFDSANKIRVIDEELGTNLIMLL